MKKCLGLAFAVFIIHYIFQFYAWGIAPGNTVFNQTNNLLSRLWPIFSFPVFYIIPRDWANYSFQFMTVINSLIWALGISGMATLIKRV